MTDSITIGRRDLLRGALVISAVGYETETRSIEARADMLLSLSLRKQEGPKRAAITPPITACSR